MNTQSRIELGRPIVAGVDGSAESTQAVRWAAAAAERRHLPLRLVHANHRPTRYHSIGRPYDQMLGSLSAQERRWLRDAAHQAGAAAPSVVAHTALVAEDPVAALITESRTASMVVVGSRGLGGFAGLLLGSVGVALAAHAHCPVAVIRTATPTGPVPTTGPVVVGIDGTDNSLAATELAFDEAADRKAPLVAVHTWSDLPLEPPFGPGPSWPETTEVEIHERRVLAERLSPWTTKHPEVPVRRVVTRDKPAASLLAQAKVAQLLVVGSHGRGGFTGMLLGSTSQALLHHAPCPIIVVRPKHP
jgi:nucleotide-binding universal stress UspA family protein